MDTREYFKKLYGGCKEGYITITTLPGGVSEHISITEIDRAADRAVELGKMANTYHGVALRRAGLGTAERGGSDDIITVPSLFADIDIRGEAHKKEALPETIEEATGFLVNLSIFPTVIIQSGNGLQAQWILEEPFIIKNEADRDFIKAISGGFGRYLREEGNKRGWELDVVQDIPRMLRIPGTLNFKTNPPNECVVLSSDGPYCKLADVENYKLDIQKYEPVTEIDAECMGSAERMCGKCGFIDDCIENAAALGEPSWHAMASIVSLTSDGKDKMHEWSEAYPNYSYEETEYKYQRAVKAKKPCTCAYIRDVIGFKCPEGGCDVRSPITFAMLSKEERLDALMQKELTIEDVLADQGLMLAAYAKENNPAMYIRLKQKIKPLGIGLRDFDKAVNKKAEEYTVMPIDVYFGEIELEGIDCNGANMPQGLMVSMEGIQKTTYVNGFQTLTPICSTPVIITKRLCNIDSSMEKVELSFFRNNRWKSFVAPRSAVFNKNTLIRYADSGLPVTSDSAPALVQYLSDYEVTNTNVIPFVRSIGRLGWFGNEFYPYAILGEVQYESDINEDEVIVQSLHEQGDYSTWLEVSIKARENDLARAMLSSSFASPLLELLRHRVILIHFWHSSRSGKTAMLKMGLSVWGNPLKLMGNFNTTSVGLERRAGTFKHLPFGIDELQSLNERRLTPSLIIYGLGNGYGKTRGSKNGGLQDIPT